MRSFFLAYLTNDPTRNQYPSSHQPTRIINDLFKWSWLVDLNIVCIALCIFPVIVFGFIQAEKATEALHGADMSNVWVIHVFVTVPDPYSFKETWWVCARGKRAETHKACSLVWEVCRREEREREKRSDTVRIRKNEKQSELDSKTGRETEQKKRVRQEKLYKVYCILAMLFSAGFTGKIVFSLLLMAAWRRDTHCVAFSKGNDTARILFGDIINKGFETLIGNS